MTYEGAEILTPNYEKPRIPFMRLVFLGIVVVLPNALGGFTQTYSAVALPQMNLTVADTSLFASAPGYTAPFGAIVLAIVIDAYGRRATLLCCLIPHIVGWLLIYLNYDLTVTNLGRLTTGFSTGIIFYSSLVYASECLTVNYTPRLRTYFATLTGIAEASGIIITFLLSCYADYVTVAGYFALLSVGIFLSLFVWVPESPAWLHLQGRTGDAEISRRKLGIFRPILADSRTEDAAVVLPVVPTFKFRWSEIEFCWPRMKQKDVRKPTLMTTILLILTNCTGGMVFLSYMVDIMKIDPNEEETRGETTSSYAYSVISGILVLVSRVCISFTLPYFGGRKIMMFSCLIMSAGSFAIGYTLLATELAASLYTIHVVAVWLVTFTFNYGVANVPLVTLSDMFPENAKGFAGIPILSFLLSATAVVSSYPYLNASYGGYIYYGYAVAAVLCALFAFLFLPEVVGKTGDEIRQEINKYW